MCDFLAINIWFECLHSPFRTKPFYLWALQCLPMILLLNSWLSKWLINHGCLRRCILEIQISKSAVGQFLPSFFPICSRFKSHVLSDCNLWCIYSGVSPHEFKGIYDRHSINTASFLQNNLSLLHPCSKAVETNCSLALATEGSIL